MSDKLQKTIQRFQAKIDSGSFYEAHQTLRTITNRYVKSKQYNEAIEILSQGAVILGKNKEYGSSSDLIGYMVEVMKEAHLEDKVRLIEAINYLPDTDISVVDLAKQVGQLSSKKFGDAELHHFFGVKLLNAVKQGEVKVFPLAEVHLVLGTYQSVPIYSDFLYEWWKANASVDAGLFLARGVINYAYLKNIKFARDAADRFITRMVQDGKLTDKITEDSATVYVDSNSPLLTFLQLLLLALTKDASKFTKLVDHYKADLVKHSLKAPVDHLGSLYFNLKGPAAAPNMLSFMGDLFK